MIVYLQKIWVARYFWYHLMLSDLRIKYRRSSLGMAWSFLHPLILTLMLAVIFGAIFKAPFLEFAPFVYSGLVLWELFVSSFTAGAQCFINAEAYIKQFNHPLAIYSLKQTLVNLTTFSIGFIGVLLWCFIVYPENILITIVCLPVSLLISFLLMWSITTISGFINTKYRDFQQLMVIIMQAIWFVSPIYFEPKIFINAGLPGLVNYNPVTHLLNLFRKPMIEGVVPTIDDFGYSVAILIFFVVIAIRKIKKEEKNLIFYL